MRSGFYVEFSVDEFGISCFESSFLFFIFGFWIVMGSKNLVLDLFIFWFFDMKSKKKKRGWRWDEKRVSFGSSFFRRVMPRKMVFFGE